MKTALITGSETFGNYLTNPSNWIYNDKYCTQAENNTVLDSTRKAKESIAIDLSPWDTTTIEKRFLEVKLQ